MWPNFEYLRFPEKNRLRFFSFFFALSFLFWIITKLSNNFSSSIKFQVNFINIPDSIILDDDLNLKLKAEISASGFELLIYHLFKDEIDVSIANADYTTDIARVDLNGQRYSLQEQLYKNARLSLISPPFLNFSYAKLKRMKIPVIPPDKINFKPGYARADEWLIEPDSVWVYGSSQKVNSLKGLSVEPFLEGHIDYDIDQKVKLLKVDQIKYETESVMIKTRVKRFTEKSIEAYINIKNLPDSLSIKLFPQSLKVTFLVLIDKAGEIKGSDFNFICDFDHSQGFKKNTLSVILEREPMGVINVRWNPKKVDYLIRE